MEKEQRKVAVFDIDGTVFRSSLALELIECLIEKDIFTKESRNMYEEEFNRWHARQGEHKEYVNKVIECFESQLKGVSYQSVADTAGEIIEEKRNHVYRYTRDLINELKQKGYYLLAISHSPKLIVDGFAYEAGFDKSYGTFLPTGPSGNFTGDIEYEEIIDNKSAVLLRVLRKENVTLKGSVGVGDTDSDISMLEMVEHPIAFNPNKELYAHAKRRGWEIVVERKDVIYNI